MDTIGEAQGKRKVEAVAEEDEHRSCKARRSSASGGFLGASPGVVSDRGHSTQCLNQQSRAGANEEEHATCQDESETQSDLSAETTEPQELCLLPSLAPAGKKGTLVLDMDKTLIYKEWRLQRADQRPHVVVEPDFVFQIVYRGYAVEYYVKQRPYLMDFLQKAAELFEVVLFTASEALVTIPVIQELDPERRLIHHVLCRNSCTEVGSGSFVKDLSRLGRDLSKVVIVDDNPDSFMWHQDNAILIAEFGGWEEDDTELCALVPVLEQMAAAEDMRTVVAELSLTTALGFAAMGADEDVSATKQEAADDVQEDSDDNSTVYL